MEPGFYWAAIHGGSRPDLTVVRLWHCGGELCVDFCGNVNCPTLAEAQRENGLEILQRIAEPVRW